MFARVGVPVMPYAGCGAEVDPVDASDSAERAIPGIFGASAVCGDGSCQGGSGSAGIPVTSGTGPECLPGPTCVVRDLRSNPFTASCVADTLCGDASR